MNDNVVTEALVNKKTGEVMEIGLQKTPDEIILDASEAARTLKKLIDSNTQKPLVFNKKQYLEYPHWQTIGKFFHTAAATGDAEFVEVGGVKGFKASGRVIDEKTGLVVGGAEAFCLVDEPNWKHKPLFQLASMAQTRAACKALSNKYRYVAILAGYEPTPAEEVDPISDRNIQTPRERPAEIEMGDPPPEMTDKKMITTKQRAMLFARCRDANIPEDVLKLFLDENFGITSTNDLTRDHFDMVLKWVDAYKVA